MNEKHTLLSPIDHFDSSGKQNKPVANAYKYSIREPKDNIYIQTIATRTKGWPNCSRELVTHQLTN